VSTGCLLGNNTHSLGHSFLTCKMILYSHFYAEIEKQMVSNHVLPTPPQKKSSNLCNLWRIKLLRSSRNNCFNSGLYVSSPNILKKQSLSFIITSKAFKMPEELLGYIYFQTGLVYDHHATSLNFN
jgi:hypothetical protein